MKMSKKPSMPYASSNRTSKPFERPAQTGDIAVVNYTGHE